MWSLVGLFLELFYVVDLQWFDASCRRASEAQHTAHHAWCRARSADNQGRFLLARSEVKRVHSTAGESHNELTRDALKHYAPVLISGGKHLKARSLL